MRSRVQWALLCPRLRRRHRIGARRDRIRRRVRLGAWTTGGSTSRRQRSDGHVAVDAAAPSGQPPIRSRPRSASPPARACASSFRRSSPISELGHHPPRIGATTSHRAAPAPSARDELLVALSSEPLGVETRCAEERARGRVYVQPEALPPTGKFMSRARRRLRDLDDAGSMPAECRRCAIGLDRGRLITMPSGDDKRTGGPTIRPLVAARSVLPGRSGRGTLCVGLRCRRPKRRARRDACGVADAIGGPATSTATTLDTTLSSTRAVPPHSTRSRAYWDLYILAVRRRRHGRAIAAASVLAAVGLVTSARSRRRTRRRTRAAAWVSWGPSSWSLTGTGTGS